MTTSYVSITDFGAKGDGKTDNRAAIQKAVDYAKANGKSVYVPAGTFLHNGMITLTGVDMVGAGANAILKAVGSESQAIRLNGDGASLSNLTLDSDKTARGNKGVNAKVLVEYGTNFKVEGVTILNAFSAGILVDKSSNGQVLNNTVKNTNADSIHMTGGSHHVLVQGNRVERSGDDGIAVVSYHANLVAHDITIIDNDVYNNEWGRGISVIGGKDVDILNNYVNGNLAGLSGIHVAIESAYTTPSTDGVLIRGNTVLNTGGYAKGHGGITLHDGIAGPTIRNVVIENNVVQSPFRDAVQILGNDIQYEITGNVLNGLAQAGIESLKVNTARLGSAALDTERAGVSANELVTGGNLADLMAGAGGADKIYGNLSNDTLLGDAGNDTLEGGGGNDLIDGGAGSDLLYGGAGVDLFLFQSGDGSDQIKSFSYGEGDRMVLSGGLSYSVKAGSGGALVSLSGGGSVTLLGVSAGSVKSDWFIYA